MYAPTVEYFYEMHHLQAILKHTVPFPVLSEASLVSTGSTIILKIDEYFEDLIFSFRAFSSL